MLRSLSFVKAKTVRTDSKGMRILVVRSSQYRYPRTDEMGSASKNIRVQALEEYIPSFEDVFVELVRPVGESWVTFSAASIRSSSFLRKEIYEILRQPRLVATLVLGPFLILFLFGIGYRAQQRSFMYIDCGAF